MDGKQHITTIEGIEKSKTWTKQEVEEFTTEKQASDQIKELGLTLPYQALNMPDKGMISMEK